MTACEGIPLPRLGCGHLSNSGEGYPFSFRAYLSPYYDIPLSISSTCSSNIKSPSRQMLPRIQYLDDLRRPTPLSPGHSIGMDKLSHSLSWAF